MFFKNVDSAIQLMIKRYGESLKYSLRSTSNTQVYIDPTKPSKGKTYTIITYPVISIEGSFIDTKIKNEYQSEYDKVIYIYNTEILSKEKDTILEVLTNNTYEIVKVKHLKYDNPFFSKVYLKK